MKLVPKAERDRGVKSRPQAFRMAEEVLDSTFVVEGQAEHERIAVSVCDGVTAKATLIGDWAAVEFVRHRPPVQYAPLRPNESRISCEGAARQPPRRPRLEPTAWRLPKQSAPSPAACAG